MRTVIAGGISQAKFMTERRMTPCNRVQDTKEREIYQTDTYKERR